jgi:hypothetical protein
VPKRYFSIGRAVGMAAVIAVTFGPLAGCAVWNPDRWNLDRYRDQRAIDIESRLAREKPIVENPF